MNPQELPAKKSLKTISWLDKLNANVLLAITPEYSTIQQARGKGYGKQPTFRQPAPMPLDFKDIAGVKVRFAHAARQDSPTVILMNPLPQSIVAFAPLWDGLASHFNLYAYDLPGFGSSEGGVEHMTFEAQGRFLHDFIAEFGIQSPHLVGPDIGMPAALAYVAHFPNDVASLLIGDGPGIAPSNNGSVINKIANSAFWRLVFKIAGAATFVQAGNSLCYVNYVPNEEEISDYISSYSGRIGPVTQWFRNYPEGLAYVDATLSEIDKPVLIFWGAQDQLLLEENSRRLSERLNRSRRHVFENCGHYSYQDQHAAFLSMVVTWVSSEHKSV
jgi:pimeloyl-ACP methyl ester carboxylesterase